MAKYAKSNNFLSDYFGGDADTKRVLKEQKKALRQEKARAKNTSKAAKVEEKRQYQADVTAANKILAQNGYAHLKAANMEPGYAAKPTGAYRPVQARPQTSSYAAARPVSYSAKSASYAPRPSYATKPAQPMSGTYRAPQTSAYRPAQPVRPQTSSYAATSATAYRRPQTSYAKKPQYGYVKVSPTREMPIPVTKSGTVPVSYLRAVNEGRTARAQAQDYAGGAAKRVYPARPTPKQATSWINNPGRSDISGIDCPRGTPATIYSRNAAPAALPAPKATLPAYKTYKTPRGTPYKTLVDKSGKQFRVPVDSDGKVPKAYLEYINDTRPKSAKTLDGDRVAKSVIGYPVTPYQARPWALDPGSHDIVGIDAPAGTTITITRPATAAEAKAQKSAKCSAAGKKGAAAAAKKKASKSAEATTEKAPAKKSSSKAKTSGKTASKPAGKTASKPAAKQQSKTKTSKPASNTKETKTATKTTPSKPAASKQTSQPKAPQAGDVTVYTSSSPALGSVNRKSSSKKSSSCKSCKGKK